MKKKEKLNYSTGTTWTEKILSDQESKDKVAIRLIGSFLIILSGLILFSDKVLTFELENKFGFNKTSTFIWVVSQTLSPILMLLASVFKPYKTSYLIPVYIYTIQFIWIFQPQIRFDNYYLQTYAIGACIGFIALMYVINRINNIKTKKEKEYKRFQQETLETIELLKKSTLE